MKYLIEKDKKKRKLFKKKENITIALKSLIYDRNRPLMDKLNIKISQIANHTFSSVVFKNRCILSGRSRSIYRLGKISRLKFRELASDAYLSGVRKASW